MRGRHRILQVCVARSNSGFNNRVLFLSSIPLELVPGISVGVLTKIFPLRCRGSDPSGGSCWLRRSTCVHFEKRKVLYNVRERSSFLPVSLVSVNGQTFTFAEVSQVLRCTSRKVDLVPRSRLCHELLHVALGSDPFPKPELSQDPCMHPCVCSKLR